MGVGVRKKKSCRGWGEMKPCHYPLLSAIQFDKNFQNQGINKVIFNKLGLY